MWGDSAWFLRKSYPVIGRVEDQSLRVEDQSLRVSGEWPAVRLLSCSTSPCAWCMRLRCGVCSRLHHASYADDRLHAAAAAAVQVGMLACCSCLHHTSWGDAGDAWRRIKHATGLGPHVAMHLMHAGVSTESASTSSQQLQGTLTTTTPAAASSRGGAPAVSSGSVNGGGCVAPRRGCYRLLHEPDKEYTPSNPK